MLGIVGGLTLLGCCLAFIGLIATYLQHAFRRPTELRLNNLVYPLLPVEEAFFYFGNKGKSAAIWLQLLNLDHLAKSVVSKHVVVLCSRCGKQLPLGARRCGPCHGALAVVVFRPLGAAEEGAVIAVDESRRNAAWICIACETFNEESAPVCEVCDASR